MYQPPRRQRLHHIREIQRTQDQPLRQLNVAAKRDRPRRHQDPERLLHAGVASVSVFPVADRVGGRRPQGENGEKHAGPDVGAQALSHDHFVASEEIVAVEDGVEGMHHGEKAAEVVVRNCSVYVSFSALEPGHCHEIQRRRRRPAVLHPEDEILRIVAHQRAHLRQRQ
ncbi:hypothetical protein Trco_007210 [Trichoderma cornu-damae]|uniref:Uncharacterized protein n=1 Tax=Trichoderma cornu-damae TaxID=654480 RepID=A0A9P8QFR3_9HYPO|nr:hypothetical protein Trco_007210 [Trichoderma cornu-damae]